MDPQDLHAFDDETVAKMTPYEQDVCAEIVEWAGEEPGTIRKAAQKAQAWVSDGIGAALPYKEVLARAVSGGLKALQDASRQTIQAGAILKKARKQGIDAGSLEALRSAPLEDRDELAGSLFTWSKVLGGLEGAATGATGLPGALADVPGLLGLSLREVQKIGTAYGYDVSRPAVRPVVLRVLDAGAGASVASKTGLLTDLHVTAEAMARSWTYKKVAQTTQTGVAVRALKEATKGLPRKISRQVTKQRLAQALPAVGAVVGGGFNYWFMSRVVRAAQMTFRSLDLKRRYVPTGETAVAGLARGLVQSIREFFSEAG